MPGSPGGDPLCSMCGTVEMAHSRPSRYLANESPPSVFQRSDPSPGASFFPAALPSNRSQQSQEELKTPLGEGARPVVRCSDTPVQVSQIPVRNGQKWAPKMEPWMETKTTMCNSSSLILSHPCLFVFTVWAPPFFVVSEVQPRAEGFKSHAGSKHLSLPCLGFPQPLRPPTPVPPRRLWW